MNGFKYAFNGIKEALTTQVNFRFHFAATLIVVSTGVIVGLSELEWACIIICIGLVIITELINTSIEYLVDLVHPDHHPLAGKVKDLAAGAVLMAAIISSVVGLIIFLPKILELIG